MRTSFVAALLLCASSMLYGQSAEFAVSGGQSQLADKELGSGYALDNGFRLGFRLTLNTWNFFGQEVGYAYNRTKLVYQEAGQEQEIGGMAIHQGNYNLLAYATPEGSRFRPFATGGVHFSNFVPPGASAQYGQGSTKFGFNYGGGLKVKVGDRFQVRFDYRQFVTGKPLGNYFPVSGSLKQNEISVGFGMVL
jgi:opacity protein-like surface antigen